MRFRELRYSVVLIFLATIPAVGQEIEELRLHQLLEEVIEQNPQIRSAEQRWNAFKQRPDRVGSYEDPMLSYTRWLSTPETRVGPQTNVFMLSQRIPFPGKLGSMEDMAREDATAAGEAYAVSRRDLVLMAKQSYYELRRIDASLVVLDEYMDLLRNFLAVSETKYLTGEGIQANVFKSQVEITSTLKKRLGLAAERESVAARINALRNRPPQDPVGRTVETGEDPLMVQDSILVESGLGMRQELNIASAMVRKSDNAESYARLDYLPSFSFSAAYVTIPDGLSPAPDAGKDPYSIGIALNIPIMLGRRDAAIEEARAMTSAQELHKRSLENTIAAEILELSSQIRDSKQSISIYESGLLSQAQSSLASGMSAYGTGNMGYLNLLDAYRMLLHIRLGYISEQSRHNKLIAAMERAVGGILPR